MEKKVNPISIIVIHENTHTLTRTHRHTNIESLFWLF